MTLRSTCAIVLKIVDHGESDKLVTFYSNNLGRITGIAKGAKKSRHRFVNKLELFSRLQMLYRPPRNPSGLLFISEAELLCAHLSLRTSFQRYVAAMYICELLLRFTRDSDPDPQLYALLQWALVSLDHADTPQKITALYHLQLLAVVGYRPEIQQCGHCGHPVGPGRSYLFIPGSGSLLCSACHHQQGPHSSRLSVQALKFLASAQMVPLERLNRLQLSRQTAAEAMEALYHYTFHLLQQDIHSWQAMRALAAVPARKKNAPSPGAIQATSGNCPSATT
jgi:DNA repair protein RecO (recombination protein O)